MKEVLVVANRTLGGAKLLDAVRARAAEGDVRFRLVVPQSEPRAGLVVYDEAVRESAQVRVDLALSLVAGESIDATGEVGDPDPFLATMDAIGTRRPDEVIISTYPAVSSGWQRRDLIERIRNASGLPVEHIVADIDQEGLPFAVTLVLASKTLEGENLLERLKQKGAADGQTAVHRRRAAAGRHRRGSARGARAPCDAARPPARGRPARVGHDRRSRSLQRRCQRAGAVPRR